MYHKKKHTFGNKTGLDYCSSHTIHKVLHFRHLFLYLCPIIPKYMLQYKLVFWPVTEQTL